MNTETMCYCSYSGAIEQWITVKASEELIKAELSPLCVKSTIEINPITILNSYFYSFGGPALSPSQSCVSWISSFSYNNSLFLNKIL